jgi:hypothetical protein
MARHVCSSFLGFLIRMRFGIFEFKKKHRKRSLHDINECPGGFISEPSGNFLSYNTPEVKS